MSNDFSFVWLQLEWVACHNQPHSEFLARCLDTLLI